jgi:hypothetical protein
MLRMAYIVAKAPSRGGAERPLSASPGLWSSDRVGSDFAVCNSQADGGRMESGLAAYDMLC